MNYKNLISYDYLESEMLPNGAIAVATRSRSLVPSIKVILDANVILTITVNGNNLDIWCQPDYEALRTRIEHMLGRMIFEDGKVSYSTTNETTLIKTLQNLVYHAGQI